MRDLTQTEIDNAPEWATHYVICDQDNDVIYESKELCWWSSEPEPIVNLGIGDKAEPIPRKEFDFDGEFREKVRKIALENGFKFKQQPDGNMDLNPYVFEFAKALLKANDL